MPEGDVVCRTARRLSQALNGRPLTRSGFRAPAPPGDVVRLVLANVEWQAVGVKLGVVGLVTTAEEHRLVGHRHHLSGRDAVRDVVSRGDLAVAARGSGRGHGSGGEARAEIAARQRRAQQQGDNR
ncbi:hypothetical protein GCM10023075_70500 [Streptosporangium album]